MLNIKQAGGIHCFCVTWLCWRGKKVLSIGRKWEGKKTSSYVPIIKR